jgi:hypothetical protein
VREQSVAAAATEKTGCEGKRVLLAGGEVDREHGQQSTLSFSQVLSLRKIESLKQIYEQLPHIKQYIFDSYDYGELGAIAHKPSHGYLEMVIEKQMR